MPELLDRQEILGALQDLADELGPGTCQHVVVLAGGSLMALHGLREATRDVGLNASAAAWRPQTLREQDCAVVLEHPRLLVLGAPLREVFLMKLVSPRARDADDLPALWPHTGFGTPEEAVEVLYSQAYPAEQPDEHLAAFLRSKLGLEALRG